MTAGGGMFAPVSLPIGSTDAAPTPAPSPWTVIVPVPEDAPAPPATHKGKVSLGVPAKRYEWRAADGGLIFYTCRFELSSGDKEMRPLSFAEHPKWGRQWRWLAPPRPRPLYGLDRLAARREAPVVIAEGEKSADAAGALLPGHVAVTSGGSKTAKVVDWAPLAGRTVVVWPDADKPGQAYAAAVAEALASLSPAPAVAVIAPPQGVAEGWDAADALAEGWTAERAQALVASAAPPAAGDAEGGSKRRRPQRDGLLDQLGEAELWHDPEGVGYASVPVNGHRENYEIGRRPFRNWLAWRAYEATGLAPGGQVLDDALRVAEAVAVNRGPCYPTWRRVAEHRGKVYLDLGCERWRAVEVDAAGWRVVDDPAPKFLRARGVQALPEPDPGELIEGLREFVNVENDADFRLLVAWLVASLRPIGPFPVLILIGQQGSAKSTAARICRLLIDPNTSPIRSVPKDERDLSVSAFSTWALVYDNLSNLPGWLSDALCRISTGGGFATRQLQTDRDETIFDAQRPVILNGIGEIGTRGDLTDRAISLTLPPLADDKRRPERELWSAFGAARPGILGALLDAVAAGIRNLATTTLDRPPRMADFATWAEACAPGLGWQPGEFLADYAENRREGREAAADASPLLPIVEAVLGRGGFGPVGFDGTAAELLVKLREVTGETQQRARWFPNTPSAVGSQLRRLAPLLEERGIVLDHYKAPNRAKTRKTALRCATPELFEALSARQRGAAQPSDPPA